ncbi:hypothetical protein C5F59_009690 [Streptomyces sp. QL37]|uniref:hypothetical protein n=1 Tax=Streptomyces sp. QL37 TaxID=2093747 RepID=UPI000CF2A0C5|nr:hypothetical protein [Streptomyces sp. QL37]PPQ60276.1 hypothetical protein C5F59_29070 [Streptomyces sp. QL37]
MEQRIDSNTKPEFAAGTDPAYIPGLTAPAPARTEADAEAEEAAPRKPGEAEETRETGTADALAEGVVDDSTDAPDAASDAASDGTVSDDTAGGDEVPADAAATAAEAVPGKGAADEDGPVFEVSDRRGSIRVDADGVRFRLDDQEAEFDWSEIGAVEVKTGRFGRRFTVTVHLSSRRWFNAEVEAGARSDLKKWTTELDEALDAHFEEA